VDYRAQSGPASTLLQAGFSYHQAPSGASVTAVTSPTRTLLAVTSYHALCNSKCLLLLLLLLCLTMPFVRAGQAQVHSLPLCSGRQLPAVWPHQRGAWALTYSGLLAGLAWPALAAAADGECKPCVCECQLCMCVLVVCVSADCVCECQVVYIGVVYECQMYVSAKWCILESCMSAKCM
jgi:hypothetical protein